MYDIEALESRVMKKLLAGDHPILGILRSQFLESRVVKREFTRVGFFTSFAVTDNAPQIKPSRRIVIGDVSGDFECLEMGCGFILFVNGGILDTLECHLWGDLIMPENAKCTRLYYTRKPNDLGIRETKERDMQAVNAILDK